MTDRKNRVFDDLQARGIVDKFASGLDSEALKMTDQLSYYVSKYKLDGDKTYFVKQSDELKSVASISSANLCDQAGILTPPIYMLRGKNKKSIKTLQQNVEELDGIEAILARDDVEYSQIQKKVFGKFKWQMFYDEELMSDLLRFMTLGCLTQFQNMFLIDELRTDVDRHTKNYFFYKTKDSKKYQGVIAIDLELMAIYDYCGAKKDDFINFLAHSYQSALPHQLYDKTNYIQRVCDMRQLLQDGVLSEANIKAMAAALEYDFPADMKDICKKNKFRKKDINEIVVPIERLWEYNQKTIGQDLGL